MLLAKKLLLKIILILELLRHLQLPHQRLLTIPSDNNFTSKSNYGYQPSVLLTSNQITSVFKGLGG